MVKAAEPIAGLNFTDAQRELLIGDVNNHLNQYEHLRKIPLANDFSHASALHLPFSPR